MLPSIPVAETMELYPLGNELAAWSAYYQYLGIEVRKVFDQYWAFPGGLGQSWMKKLRR